MAYLSFDVNNLELTVKVGVCETYKPSKELKKLNKKCELLKAEVKDYLDKTFGTTDYSKITKILNENKEQDQKLNDFVTERVSPVIHEIYQEIVLINERICPNYEDIVKNK